MENNHVVLHGLVTEKNFGYELRGEKFYFARLLVERSSGAHDELNIVISDRVRNGDVNVGEYIKVEGEFRSRNVPAPGRNRLELRVFAVSVKKFESDFDYLFSTENNNKIELDGYICRQCALRQTPLGRTITDTILAVNRTNGRTDYIPCITWGRTAEYVSGLPVGSRINCEGRIQSREYQKRISEDITETHTAYEVSLHTVWLVKLGVTAQEDRDNG